MGLFNDMYGSKLFDTDNKPVKEKKESVVENKSEETEVKENATSVSQIVEGKHIEIEKGIEHAAMILDASNGPSIFQNQKSNLKNDSFMSHVADIL